MAWRDGVDPYPVYTGVGARGVPVCAGDFAAGVNWLIKMELIGWVGDVGVGCQVRVRAVEGRGVHGLGASG